MFPNATRCAFTAHLILVLGAGCTPDPTSELVTDAGADARTADARAASLCPTAGDGLECLFDLFDEVTDTCDPDALDRLRGSLLARRGSLPAWHRGRALFVSHGRAVSIAGDFNGWSPTALATGPLCGSDLFTAEAPVPSGRHGYKLIDDSQWILDPESWAFAHDDFEGNPEGRNSVLNTYDSGLGHLVQPAQELCSDQLGNCRPLTAYLPPGYHAPSNAHRSYPVIFMHDGQNIFDDHDCCFGHTGWEVNVALDHGIAAGIMEPAIVVGFDHAGSGRIDEYGVAESAGGSQEAFMSFQVGAVQSTAASLWRLDAQRYYVAGSSLGGLISFRLAFAYPEVYAGAASLSGTFGFGQETGTAMRDFVHATGKIDVALYMDHGGTAETGADNYRDNVELRDLLVETGYVRNDSPDCVSSPQSLCYFHDVGATHDELAWRDRAHRFLEYFLAPSQG